MGTGARDSEEMKLHSEDEDKIHDAGERELFRDARGRSAGNRGSEPDAWEKIMGFGWQFR